MTLHQKSQQEMYELFDTEYALFLAKWKLPVPARKGITTWKCLLREILKSLPQA